MSCVGGLTEKWHLIVWLPVVVFIVRVLTLVMSQCIANLTSGETSEHDDTLSSTSFCVFEFKLKAAATVTTCVA